MPSTDIDGSPIVILGEEEARVIYLLFLKYSSNQYLFSQEIEIINKLSKTFNWVSFHTTEELPDGKRSNIKTKYEI